MSWDINHLKFGFGSVCVITMGCMQVAAWVCGFNGAVFALTSAVIGAVAGSLLGFELGKKSN